MKNAAIEATWRIMALTLYPKKLTQRLSLMSQTLKAIRGTRDLLPRKPRFGTASKPRARRIRPLQLRRDSHTCLRGHGAFCSRRGRGDDIVSKEMYTWEDGERFNEQRMIVDWESLNRSDDPTHVQAGRAHVERLSPLLTQLNAIGFSVRSLGELRFLGSNSQEAHLNLFVSGQGFPARRYPRFLKRGTCQIGPSEHLRQTHVRLRLVVPANAADNPWVERHDVTIQWFEGNFFDSAQSLTLRRKTQPEWSAPTSSTAGRERPTAEALLHWPAVRRERRRRALPAVLADRRGGHRAAVAGSESPLRDAEILECWPRCSTSWAFPAGHWS